MFSSCIRSVTFILLVLFTVSVPGLAESGSEEPVVLVLGDSLSAAHGMELEESWVTLLQGRLQKHNPRYQVINASVSGDTSRTALNRLRKNLTRYNPDLCLVELGGNDGLQGLPAAELNTNLDAIITLCRRSARQVLLFEIQIPMNYGPVYRDQLQAVYKELGNRDGVSLVPFFLQDVFGQPGMMQSDGIHPSAAAQPRLMEKVWIRLEPFL